MLRPLFLEGDEGTVYLHNRTKTLMTNKQAPFECIHVFPLWPRWQSLTVISHPPTPHPL